MNAAATPPVALAKSLVFIFGLIPALLLWWNFRHDLLGADPIAAAQQESGRWALNFLLLTLCVSPLRTLTQLHWLLRLRRMLGLFAFSMPPCTSGHSPDWTMPFAPTTCCAPLTGNR